MRGTRRHLARLGGLALAWLALGGTPLPARGQGAVAFQPTIGTFPDGVFLNVTPVVSADRRYVRLGMAPQFLTLNQMDVFTIPAAVQGGVGNGFGGGGGLGVGGALGGLGGGGFGGGGAGGFASVGFPGAVMGGFGPQQGAMMGPGFGGVRPRPATTARGPSASRSRKPSLAKRRASAQVTSLRPRVTRPIPRRTAGPRSLV